VKIELLFFEGCPNHRPAGDLVHSVLAELGLTADVNAIEVVTPEDVTRLRFLGSPTIRVDGQDIEEARRNDRNFAMSCRRYGDAGLPPRELLVRALKQRT
jgi:hypothetical protein